MESSSGMSLRSLEHDNAYEEMHKIGKGAYGVVYKGKDKHTGKVVALKKICVPLTDEGMPGNSLREISLLKQLNVHEHPNVVRLLDVCHGQQKERELVMFLVFEHVEQDLSQYLDKAAKRGGLKSPQIRQITSEILQGVDFLHSNRIVHRDLKPQNLLVTHDGHIKLADFGLAKTYDFEMKLTSVVVTLWYRAPEVLLGRTYATPVDIWSIGCILAELYNGEALFCGTSESDQLNKIFAILGKPSEAELSNYSNLGVNINAFEVVRAKPVDLKRVLRNLCCNAHDLIMRMLTFDPSKRITALQALDHVYLTEEPLNT